MLFYILFFITFFLVCLAISSFVLIKKDFILDKLHVIIAAVCMTIWVIYFHFTFGIFGEFFTGDFGGFYQAGRRVLKDPTTLYNFGESINPYPYLPSFATSFSISFSLLPFEIGYITFFILNYILGILSIIEYNRILRLLNVKEKKHRFLFLIIISNGYLVYVQFYFNMFKIIMFIIFLYVVRREIQYRIGERVKDYKYYMVNYGLFIYAIGVAPYFLFLFLIYIFHDIKLKKLFQSENVKKYIIAITFFLIENFLFILYPSLIFDFFKGFFMPVYGRQYMRMLYLKDLYQPNKQEMSYILIIFTSILALISLILILKKNMKIEEKFSYFCFAYLFFGVFSHQILLGIILFSFILLLFIPYLNQEAKGIEFVKENKIVLIGLISISLIFFLTNNFIFILFFPIYFELENDIFSALYLLVLHIIMVSCFFLLYLKKTYFSSSIEESLTKNPFIKRY